MNDRRIFTIYCALVLFGHNKQYREMLPVHQIYVEIQKKLTHRGDEFDKIFKSYFLKDHYVQYLLWALRHSDFPEYRLRTNKKHPLQKPDVFFKGFDSTIKNFYKKAPMKQLWRLYKKDFERFFPYNKQTLIWVRKKLSKLGDVNFQSQEIQVIPNLLETKGTGFGILVPPTAYVIFSPSHTMQDRILILHELLHTIVNPLIDNNRNLKKRFTIFQSLYNQLTTIKTRKYYPRWQWIGYEYLVKIVLLGLLTESERKKQISFELKWGFKRIRKIYDIYNKQQEASLENSLRSTIKEMKKLDSKNSINI